METNKMLAYVLISISGFDERDILSKIRDINEIKEAHILFGEWDIIAKIEAPTSEALTSVVIDKIRSLDGVELTSTLIVGE